MREPRVFEVEYGDEVFVRSPGNTGIEPKTVVIISGHDSIRLNFAIESLTELLSSLQDRRDCELARKADYAKKFPEWHDKDGNYISDQARNAVAQ